MWRPPLLQLVELSTASGIYWLNCILWAEYSLPFLIAYIGSYMCRTSEHGRLIGWPIAGRKCSNWKCIINLDQTAYHPIKGNRAKGWSNDINYSIRHLHALYCVNALIVVFPKADVVSFIETIKQPYSFELNGESVSCPQALYCITHVSSNEGKIATVEVPYEFSIPLSGGQARDLTLKYLELAVNYTAWWLGPICYLSFYDIHLPFMPCSETVSIKPSICTSDLHVWFMEGMVYSEVFGWYVTHLGRGYPINRTCPWLPDNTR